MLSFEHRGRSPIDLRCLYSDREFVPYNQGLEKEDNILGYHIGSTNVPMHLLPRIDIPYSQAPLLDSIQPTNGLTFVLRPYCFQKCLASSPGCFVFRSIQKSKLSFRYRLISAQHADTIKANVPSQQHVVLPYERMHFYQRMGTRY